MSIEIVRVVLDEALNLLSRGLCKRAIARDREGQQTTLHDKRAHTYSIVGALTIATAGATREDEFEDVYLAAYGRIFRASGTAAPLTLVNDDPDMTLEGLMMLVRKARDMP